MFCRTKKSRFAPKPQRIRSARNGTVASRRADGSGTARKLNGRNGPTTTTKSSDARQPASSTGRRATRPAERHARAVRHTVWPRKAEFDFLIGRLAGRGLRAVEPGGAGLRRELSYDGSRI